MLTLKIGTVPIFLFFAIYCAIPSFAAAKCDESVEGWCPLSAGPITTWTAPLCERGKFAIQPFFFYNRARGTFDGEGHYKAFTDKEKKSEFQEQLFIQYGLTDKIEIAAQGIYQQKLVSRLGEKATSTGFGDSYLFVRYCALEESGWLPHTTALFQLKIPTGKYQKAGESRLGTDLMGADTGGGSYDHGYGVLFTKKLKPFVFHADAVYSFPVETRVNGVKTRYANYLNWDLGAEYFLPTGFNLMVEFNALQQGDRREDGSLVPASDVGAMTIASGIGWSSPAIQTLVAYQRTLGGTNFDVKDSIVFTFVRTF